MTEQAWDKLFVDRPVSNAPRGEMPRAEHHHHDRRQANSSKRLDIQGLRAVAVIAVVVNHLTGDPRGAFVGVDVFFVISGYLITLGLLRELGPRPDGGRLGVHAYIGHFYLRRARRILPAALVVILVTVLLAHIIFEPSRAASTTRDGFWAAVFLANWHFAAVGTNYFGALGPTSPLQHYWSLSVEEQFYLVWPFALYFVALVVARNRDETHRRRAGAIAAATLCVVSLWYAYGQSSSHPITAYFSTATRGWELGIGALIACLPAMRANRNVLTAMSWVGTVIIGISLFVCHGGSGFPVPDALLPVLGSALVVAATSSTGAHAANALLTNRAATYVGDISYSIYVVHFPVIIFTGALIDHWTVPIYLAVVAAIVGLSMLLFHVIEDPIRNSEWLKLRRERGRDTAQSYDMPMRHLALVGTSLLMAAAVVFTLRAPTSDTKLATISGAISQAANQTSKHTAGKQNGPATPRLDALDNQIADALQASTWPDLNPSQSEAEVEPTYLSHCGQALGAVSKCSWGASHPTHKLYLVGDSTSVAYTPAFRAFIGKEPGWRVRTAGGFGCEFADKVLADGPQNGNAARCPSRNRHLVQEIKRVRPDMLIVTADIGSPEYVNSVATELDKVKGAVKTIVLLPAPPEVIDPSHCFTKLSHPSDCASQIGGGYTNSITNWRALAASRGWKFVEPTKWFCVDKYCPAFVGHTPTHKDSVHPTAAYVQLIAPVVQEAFRNGRLLP